MFSKQEQWMQIDWATLYEWGGGYYILDDLWERLMKLRNYGYFLLSFLVVRGRAFIAGKHVRWWWDFESMAKYSPSIAAGLASIAAAALA